MTLAAGHALLTSPAHLRFWAALCGLSPADPRLDDGLAALDPGAPTATAAARRARLASDLSDLEAAWRGGRERGQEVVVSGVHLMPTTKKGREDLGWWLGGGEA